MRLNPKYWLYRFKWNLAEKYNIQFNAPLHLDLELAGDCNLKCQFCRYGNDPFETTGMMDYNLAMDAIIQAYRMGVYSIKFQARGESALNKNLEGCIRTAKWMGILETQLNTNLVAFNEKRLKELCVSGLDVLIISIDGATKETYEKIRVGAKWSKLVSNLKYLNSIKRRPKIRIQMVYQDENKHEVKLFKREFSKLCDELKIKPIRESNKKRKRRSCGQPKQRMIVGWNGKVYGCCNCWYEESLVGDIGKKTLKVIWNDKPMETLRGKALDPAKGEPCKSCLVASSYK